VKTAIQSPSSTTLEKEKGADQLLKRAAREVEMTLDKQKSVKRHLQHLKSKSKVTKVGLICTHK
jgi:hypothetical protein